MGYNIAGILTDTKLNNQEDLKKVFQTTLKYTEDVDSESATISKHSSEYDVYTNNKGSLVLFQLGELYEFSNTKGVFIQFMISDVSDTYYFEKYNNGKLERKLIVSQGEVAEDEGSGIIDEDDDFMDIVLELSNELLAINDVFNLTFKRYI